MSAKHRGYPYVSAR